MIIWEQGTLEVVNTPIVQEREIDWDEEDWYQVGKYLLGIGFCDQFKVDGTREKRIGDWLPIWSEYLEMQTTIIFNADDFVKNQPVFEMHELLDSDHTSFLFGDNGRHEVRIPDKYLCSADFRICHRGFWKAEIKLCRETVIADTQ